jgi:hypothetical protein
MVQLALAAKSQDKAEAPPFYRTIRDECFLFEKAFALKLPSPGQAPERQPDQ